MPTIGHISWKPITRYDVCLIILQQIKKVSEPKKNSVHFIKRYKFRLAVVLCNLNRLTMISKHLTRMTEIVFVIFFFAHLFIRRIDFQCGRNCESYAQGAWIISPLTNACFSWIFCIQCSLWIFLFSCGKTYFNKVTFKIIGKKETVEQLVCLIAKLKKGSDSSVRVFAFHRGYLDNCSVLFR